MKKISKVLGAMVLVLVTCLLMTTNTSAATNHYKNGKPTWTFLFYLCGTDLESKSKFGTQTLNALKEASSNANINIVIQTGGSTKWHNSEINKDKAMRLEVRNHKLVTKWTGTKRSMGNKNTLSSFMKWGKAKYPATHTVLVLSDHGFGPVRGVIADTQFKRDSLSLPEMKQAFKDAKVHYDTVVFDTCLTANIETASMLAPYANYMVASEEVESGRGNDYKSTINYLATHLTVSPQTLAKVQVDKTKAMLAKPQKGEDAWTAEADSATFTQSVIKLSKMKQVKSAFYGYSKKLLKLQKSKKTKKKLKTAFNKVKCYEQSEEADYRTTYLDLADMTNKTKKLAPKEGKKLKAAIKNAVVYNRYGKFQGYSYGMYVYAPTTRTKKSDVKKYISRASISKSYSSFVKLIS